MAEDVRSGGVGDGDRDLTRVMDENIRALLEFRRRQQRRRRPQQRMADAVTRFAGSMKFVWLHLVLFGAWIAFNSSHVFGIHPVDPFPYVGLAMFASCEAIFLSTFVLITQNRMAELADQRADLDLLINLLAEHEITRLVKLVDAIADKLDLEEGKDPHLEELKKDISPLDVLEELKRVGAEQDS